MSNDNTNDAWAGFKLWYYTPSIAAAAIYSVIFGCLTIYHTYRLCRARAWFCIQFVVGGLFELIGYIARGLAHSNTSSVSIYTIQSLLLLLAPILFAASVYMILGRLIRRVSAEQISPIGVNKVTKIFVTSDMVCFLVQGAGGGLLSQAKTTSAINTANNIILAGLIIQILIFLVFVGVAGVFQRRLSRRPTQQAHTVPWKQGMFSLYAMSLFITLRNVFRVIEYAMGQGGYLLQHQWALYIFDGLFMIVVLTIGVFWHDPSLKKTKRPGIDVVNLETGQSLVTENSVVIPKHNLSRS